MRRLTYEQFKRKAREQIITFADQEGMDTALELAYRASLDADPVLIVGDTGTGKELVANAIHNFGIRSRHKLVPVNCALLCDDNVEQKLFGVRAGAFSGVRLDAAGGFREANKGTLFLDELHRLPTGGQNSLLRVIETGEIVRYGDDWSKADKVDVRIIAASNGEADNPEVLPEDLSARIGRHRISLPPLKERRQDVLLLFLYYLARDLPRDKFLDSIDYHVLDFMVWYPWPRNVRELRDFVKFLIDEFKPPRINWYDVRAFFRGRGWDQSTYEALVAPLNNPENLKSEFVEFLRKGFFSPYVCWFEHLRMREHSLLKPKLDNASFLFRGGLRDPAGPPYYPLKKEWLNQSSRNLDFEKTDFDEILYNVYFDLEVMGKDLLSSYRESGGPLSPFKANTGSQVSLEETVHVITKDQFYQSIAATFQRTGGNVTQTAKLHGVTRELVRSLTKGENGTDYKKS